MYVSAFRLCRSTLGQNWLKFGSFGGLGSASTRTLTRLGDLRYPMIDGFAKFQGVEVSPISRSAVGPRVCSCWTRQGRHDPFLSALCNISSCKLCHTRKDGFSVQYMQMQQTYARSVQEMFPFRFSVITNCREKIVLEVKWNNSSSSSWRRRRAASIPVFLLQLYILVKLHRTCPFQLIFPSILNILKSFAVVQQDRQVPVETPLLLYACTWKYQHQNSTQAQGKPHRDLRQCDSLYKIYFVLRKYSIYHRVSKKIFIEAISAISHEKQNAEKRNKKHSLAEIERNWLTRSFVISYDDIV